MGTSSPGAIHKLPQLLDVDMPATSIPSPIQTQSQSPMSVSTLKGSFFSPGPGAYDPEVIPPYHEARTLVLCFDGTGDQFDEDNSNIVQFFSMLKKNDKSQQLVYYQAGIGTYTIPEVATPFMAKVKKTIDMAIGNHLDAHVMGGYEFLMEHYHAGDRICIFGFSRGAYTARALAGMIHKVGLLPAGNHQQVPFAYKMFSRNDDTGRKQSKAFKVAFSVDVKIEFIGVWDTVCSVGLIPHTLPFIHSNTAIRHFRHAISLDERRAKFKANHWYVQDQKCTKHDKDAGAEKDAGQKKTDVREVWFAGCHCDVGGGSVKNDTPNSLARISLRWMIRECFRTNTGIQFRRKSFEDIGLDLDTLYQPAIGTSAHVAEPSDGTLTDQVQSSPTVASTFKTEEDEELADALSPIHDQLKRSKAWWFLEFLPMRHHKIHQGNDESDHYWKVNFGRGRKVPKPIHEGRRKILVHRSVKTRMDAELESGKYVPKANFHSFDPEWVDWVD